VKNPLLGGKWRERVLSVRKKGATPGRTRNLGAARAHEVSRYRDTRTGLRFFENDPGAGRGRPVLGFWPDEFLQWGSCDQASTSLPTQWNWKEKIRRADVCDHRAKAKLDRQTLEGKATRRR